MLQIQLTPEEQRLLIEVVEEQLSELRTEIADTDLRDYKSMLKERQKLLTQLYGKLQAVADVRAGQP